jgi:hypothetical protein
MLGAVTNTINGSPANQKKPQISPLRYAPPDFLWNLMALMYFVLLSVTKAAYATLSGETWQEIRVRSR